MELDTILDLAAKLLAAGVVALLAYLAPKVKEWLTIKIGESNTKRLGQLVFTFVSAAEQLLADDDPDGSKRKAYVEEQLKAMGVELTEYVNALIEASVYNNTL